MQKLVVLTVLAVGASGCIREAWAGETFLGTIVVSDGGTVSNATTGYGSAGCAVGGACAQAFRVPTASPISVQAVTACAVGVNSPGVDAGTGVQLTAGQFFTSSTSSISCRVPLLPDGGSYAGGCVAVSPLPGSAACIANVFSRLGNE